MAPRNQGLDSQWTPDDSRDADSYTTAQGNTYADQAQPHSQPGRQHVDSADQSKPDSYKAYVKPVQPDYGMQFEGITGDITVNRDRWFNEIPKDRTNHSVPAGDAGSFGGNQFAEFQSSDNDGYGVVIEHGKSAAFGNVQTTWVDNSRADRGPEYVESNSDSSRDSGMVGNGGNGSSSLGQGSTPPIIDYLNRTGRK